MSIALIAAQSQNRVIGRGMEIPWRVKGEQKLFKSITMGGTLIMGRKTYESIGRPLPGRSTIVISRDQSLNLEGCTVCDSLESAIALARTWQNPVFIAGGGELYRQAIDMAAEIHLTTIETEVEGDVYFPEIPDTFHVIEENLYESNINYTYQLLRRD